MIRGLANDTSGVAIPVGAADQMNAQLATMPITDDCKKRASAIIQKLAMGQFPTADEQHWMEQLGKGIIPSECVPGGTGAESSGFPTWAWILLAVVGGWLIYENI